MLNTTKRLGQGALRLRSGHVLVSPVRRGEPVEPSICGKS